MEDMNLVASSAQCVLRDSSEHHYYSAGRYSLVPPIAATHSPRKWLESKETSSFAPYRTPQDVYLL